jgi:hypothetical protein
VNQYRHHNVAGRADATTATQHLGLISVPRGLISGAPASSSITWLDFGIIKGDCCRIIPDKLSQLTHVMAMKVMHQHNIIRPFWMST